MNRIRRALARTPASSRARRFALVLLVAFAGLLALAGPAFAGAIAPESGGSPNADEIATLYKLIFAVAIVIFIGVEGCLFYSLFKFRARKGAVAAQIHGNTRLEVGWTVGAAVILVVLAVVTFAKLPSIHNPPNSGAGGISWPTTTSARLRAEQAGPAERQVAEHLRQRPAVHLALHLRQRRRQHPSTRRSPTSRWSSRSTRP